MLRLDAERFGTAEYYEATARRRAAAAPPPARLVRARVRPSPSPSCSSTPRRRRDLFLGLGDRLGAVLGGLAYGLARRSLVAVGFATLPLPPDPLPGRRGRTRARCSTRPRPRSSTRWRSAAPSSACSSSTGVDPTLANLIQALVYTLTTRLGAPGRDRYLLRPGARDRPHRRLADGRRPAASPRRSSATRSPASRSSCAPATPARPSRAAARSRRSRSGAARPRAGGSSGRGSADVAGPLTRGRGRAAARRSRSTSTSRSASRSARTATSSSTRVPPRAGRGRGSDAFLDGARTRSSSCAPTRSTRRSARRGRRSRRVYLGGGTPSLLPAEAVAALLDHVRGRGSGSPPAPRSRSRRTPVPTSAATPAALRGRRRHPALARRPVAVDAELRAPRPPAPGRATSATRSRAAREAGIGSVSLDLLYDVPGRDRSPTGSTTLEAALALEPDHLSLYALTLDDPDAEGLTGPGGDHLPTTAGARRWRDARPAGPGRGPRRGPVPPRRRTASPRPAGAATRSATGRGPATRAGTTSSTGSAGRTRRSARRPRLRRRRRGAGTRPASRATSRRSRRPTGSAPRLPPGRLRGRSTRRPRPPRRSSSACGPTAASRSRPPHEPPLARRVRLGPRRRAPRRHRRRSDRPDDPRPPALERAVRAARLSAATGRVSVDTRPARLLRCQQPVSTLTSRVLTTSGDRPWRVGTAAHSAPWTFARRRSFGPSSRNTSPPRRRSAARRSSSATASACPARPSATSSPSSRPPAC